MDNPFIGSIFIFAGNFAPLGWQLCQGQLMLISEFEALFALVGTTYGGDGISTFALPDLRGRMPVGQGNGFVVGQMAGQTQVTLTPANLPAHTHNLTAFGDVSNSNDPTGRKMANTAGLDREYRSSGTIVNMASNAIGQTGQGNPIDIQQPYLAVNYIIAMVGIFPTQS